jgi:hypothetical protein
MLVDLEKIDALPTVYSSVHIISKFLKKSVTTRGKRIYLGRRGSPESRDEPETERKAQLPGCYPSVEQQPCGPAGGSTSAKGDSHDGQVHPLL